MDPHQFEHDGHSYEARFEETPEGWIARVRREDTDTVHVIAFPEGVGFDPEDLRGSLIEGCEAIIAQLPDRAPTRH